jgi:hypothetical protein
MQAEPSPETRRLLDVLRLAIRVLGYSNREVERKIGTSGSYLSRLFSGLIELKVDHVAEVSRAIGLEPEEVFQLAFPKRRKEASLAAARVQDALADPRTGIFEAAPEGMGKAGPDEPASDLEQALEKMMAKALQRVLGRMG